MARTRKRKPALQEPASKKQKRSTEPIHLIADSHSQISQAGAISKLPPELLTHALSYILTKSAVITLHSAKSRRWRNEVLYLNSYPSWLLAYPKSVRSPLLNILLVSRAFYFAGIAAFFGENVLKFDNVEHLDRLMSKLDLDRRRCIRRITFNFPFRDVWDSGPGAIWPDARIVGERLGVCLERLPSLVQVQFCALAMHQQLRKMFEDIKEFCGSGGELLELEVNYWNGSELGVEDDDPDL